MKNLIEAALQVMQECVGIDKGLTVGTGQNSYKGVGDKDVKLKIGESMRKHGLVIFPTGVEQKTSINQWEEQTQYGNKMKQSVFTEVVCTYTLFHKSGESVHLVGFGHGVDTQDKSAGKATTYALKNTLLYSFLVATGHIDDTDATHSDALPTPQAKPAAVQQAPAILDLINEYSSLLANHKDLYTADELAALQPAANWKESNYSANIKGMKAGIAKRKAAKEAANA